METVPPCFISQTHFFTNTQILSSGPPVTIPKCQHKDLLRKLPALGHRAPNVVFNLLFNLEIKTGQQIFKVFQEAWDSVSLLTLKLCNLA